jgi:hypothetical protein
VGAGDDGAGAGSAGALGAGAGAGSEGAGSEGAVGAGAGADGAGAGSDGAGAGAEGAGAGAGSVTADVTGSSDGASTGSAEVPGSCASAEGADAKTRAPAMARLATRRVRSDTPCLPAVERSPQSAKTFHPPRGSLPARANQWHGRTQPAARLSQTNFRSLRFCRNLRTFARISYAITGVDLRNQALQVRPGRTARETPGGRQSAGSESVSSAPAVSPIWVASAKARRGLGDGVIGIATSRSGGIPQLVREEPADRAAVLRTVGGKEHGGSWRPGTPVLTCTLLTTSPRTCTRFRLAPVSGVSVCVAPHVEDAEASHLVTLSQDAVDAATGAAQWRKARLRREVVGGSLGDQRRVLGGCGITLRCEERDRPRRKC